MRIRPRTLPKTVCLPSRCGCRLSVMKNWLPLVSCHRATELILVFSSSCLPTIEELQQLQQQQT